MFRVVRVAIKTSKVSANEIMNPSRRVRGHQSDADIKHSLAGGRKWGPSSYQAVNA